MDNWIKMYRQILDSEVFSSQKMLKIWIWCLCKANYKTKNVPIKTGRGETNVKVKRGTFLFGRFKAEEELYIDGSTIYKIMKKLEGLGNIKIKSNTHYSVITICNYDKYQSKEKTKEQASNNQVTGKEQPSNTTKNDKKVNKREYIDKDFEETFNRWLKYKKDKKQGYKNEDSIKAAYNKLYKLADGSPKTASKIVEQSLANNWAGMFELKKSEKGSSQKMPMYNG